MDSTSSVRDLEISLANSRQSGDYRDALDLLSKAWPALVSTNGTGIRSLIDTLPASEWERDPWLVAGYAASFRSIGSSSRSAALPYFSVAGSLVTERTPLAVRVAIALRHAAALRSLGRLEDALTQVGEAAILCASDGSMPLTWRIQLEARVCLQRGVVRYHLGEYDEALTDLRTAAGLAEDNLFDADHVECLSALAMLEYSMGNFATSLNYVESARHHAGDTGLLESSFGVAALIAELLIAVEQDRLEDARNLAPAVASAAARSDWEPLAHYAEAAMSIISEQYVEGLEMLGRCVRSYSGWSPPGSIVTISEGLRATLLLRLGEVDTAWDILAALTPTQHHANCPARFIAHLRFLSGDAVGAAAVLKECEALGDRHSSRTMVDVQLLKAAANYQLGNDPVADLAFDRSLRLAARNDMRIPFRLVPDDVMRSMIARAATRGQSPAVRALFGQVAGSTKAALSGQPQLSDREREIVRLMVRELSASEIAGQLYISINTVKSHLKNIYRKFGSRTRAEATKKARDLGFHV